MTSQNPFSPYAVCATNSMLKYRRQGDFFQTRDEFKSMRLDRVCIEAARNEHEPFQVVILAADTDLKDVTIEAGAFRSAGGSVFDHAAITPYLVHYLCEPLSEAMYPDALLPIQPFDLPAGESQVIWFDVSVDESVEPDTYEGSVTVRPAGLPEQTVTIELTVYPFVLPAAAPTRSAFGIGTEQLTEWYGIEAGTPEFEALYDQYYWFLVDHLASPQDLPVPLDPKRMARYLDHPGVTGIRVPYSADPAIFGQTMRMFREHGWLDKAYLYPVDEPYRKTEYDRLIDAARTIHTIEPDAKVICPYYRNPEFAEEETAIKHLTGSVDIWCALNSYFHEDALRERKVDGDDVWWYTCCVPIEPYPNFQIQMPPIDHRILFWQMRYFDVQGFLYWSVNTWTDDPYTTLPAMWLDSRQRDAHSDGHLVYPGPDGPISSIRLELIREGMEDLHYLNLLEDIAGPDEVKRFVRKVVGGTTFYEQDPGRFMNVRSQLAKRISEG